MPPRVAFVLKGYPRLSETFIAQEILALEQRGLAIVIVSLRHPTDRKRHPTHRAITAPVVYLPEYLVREPRRVLAAAWRARHLAGFGAALRVWLRDLARDPTPNRVRRFGQALVLAVEVAPEVGHLHAHFLHTPASVARYAALMTGLPWTGSAHAKDIWTTPDWEKREKLASCRWLVTCSQSALHALAPLADRGKVELVYHGIDLARFAPPPARRQVRDGSDADDPVVILAVGRAVPKKGLDDLLAALAALPPGLAWRLVHIGGGPLAPKLARAAEKLGLGARVTWLGSRDQDEVIAAYRAADLFALTVKVADDGDRDGLPNVLLEAQSQGLPVVSTAVSAVPELVSDEVNGVLVREGDAAAIAGALARLIRRPDLRDRMGRAGQARVRRHFGMDAGIARLAEKFGIGP